MKKVILILASMFISFPALADFPAVRNDSAAMTIAPSNGGASLASVNLYGQLFTPARPGVDFQNCSAGISGTSRTAIKAAVASNRIYVTDVSCYNNSAVNSSMIFEDGTTLVWPGFLAANSFYEHTFSVPLRGTVNTAFNVTMGTTATSTICCITGYTSAN